MTSTYRGLVVESEKALDSTLFGKKAEEKPTKAPAKTADKPAKSNRSK